jgi:hypothetical protein
LYFSLLVKYPVNLRQAREIAFLSFAMFLLASFIVSTMTNRFSAKADFILHDPHREAITHSLGIARNILQSHPELTKADPVNACFFTDGSCNILDLRKLISLFDHISLVGLDGHALEKGIAIQGLAGNEKIRLITGFDVTGVPFVTSDSGEEGRLAKSDLSHLIRHAEQATWDELPHQFELVASICLLSQLIQQVIDNIGDDHQQFVPLIQAIRLRHIQLMLDHLRAGGIGLLFFDFVSSDTLPALPELSDEPLQRTLSAAIDNNNFFHGLNPQVILHLFETDFQDQISTVQFSKPWVWKTSERAYAVTAVMFVKKLK